MIELIKAIAMLCSIQVGSGINSSYYIKDVLELQQSCQKRLARCVIEKRSVGEDGTALLQCVRDQ